MAEEHVDVGINVWVPDEHGDDGFILGTVSKLDGDSVTVRDAASEQHVLPLSDVHPCNPENQSGCKDNTELMFLHEPHMLHNLRQRYAKDAVYTYTAHILIACNPFKKLNIYSEERMAEYSGKSLGLMEPHVFAVADRAYRNMKFYKTSQAVIISGESGSGKTETAKIVMSFLAWAGGGTAAGGGSSGSGSSSSSNSSTLPFGAALETATSLRRRLRPA